MEVPDPWRIGARPLMSSLVGIRRAGRSATRPHRGERPSPVRPTVGGRKPGACEGVEGWVASLGKRSVRRALDDFCSDPLSLTCNALGQTVVMPGHLVEYNSSIAGEE